MENLQQEDGEYMTFSQLNIAKQIAEQEEVERIQQKQFNLDFNQVTKLKGSFKEIDELPQPPS